MSHSCIQPVQQSPLKVMGGFLRCAVVFLIRNSPNIYRRNVPLYYHETRVNLR